ncbi:hypothetical protein LTR17_013186 [Elasticomyces elasticus]|nr:hypothetical protein LTR17_013186 [Elasticomyces elasticus]
MQPISNFLSPAGAGADDSSSPGPDSQRTIIAPFIQPMHKRLVDRLEDSDYIGSLEFVSELEQKYAPDYQNSRIGRSGQWKPDALFLFNSVDDRVLCSFANGTLPQRAIGDLMGVVRVPPMTDMSWVNSKKPDPVVYVNYIVDKNGVCFSLKEAREFIDAYEVAAGLKQDFDGKFVRNGRTVKEGVDAAYNRIKGTTGVEFPDVARARTVARMIIIHFRLNVFPAAEKAGSDHIMLPAECGWSIRGYERCVAHRDLTPSSPPAFKLARLTAAHMFPNRGFEHLKQYVLFDILSARHASVGESLGHILGGSYATHGGFNVEQAGKSVAGAVDATEREWMVIRNFAMNRNRFKFLDINLRSWESDEDDKIAQYQEHLQRRALESRIEETESMFIRRLNAFELEAESAEVAIEVAGYDVDAAQKSIDAANKARDQETSAIQALVDLGALFPE